MHHSRGQHAPRTESWSYREHCVTILLPGTVLLLLQIIINFLNCFFYPFDTTLSSCVWYQIKSFVHAKDESVLIFFSLLSFHLNQNESKLLGIPRLVNVKTCCIITLQTPPFLLQVDQSEMICCCLQPIRILGNKMAYGPEGLETILWLTVLMLYCTNFWGVKQSVSSRVFFRERRSQGCTLSCKNGPERVNFISAKLYLVQTGQE